MTKRSMAKKFMRETGADKKTAMGYLRQYQWNYYRAIAMYDLPQRLNRFRKSIEDIDWNAVITSFGKALEECVKSLSEALRSIDWDEAVKKIQEERGEEK